MPFRPPQASVYPLAYAPGAWGCDQWHPWGPVPAEPRLTRTAAWQAARDSPTRLVPLMAVTRSPMLRAPERSAGPP